jgi:hypothetical protein
MKEDFFETAERTDSQLGIFLEEAGQKILDLAGKFHMVREGEFFVHNGVLNLFFVARIERRETGDEFIEQRSKGIEIHTI